MDDDLDAFVDETAAQLDEIETHLLALDSGAPGWKPHVVAAFGPLHTIKGNSLYVDLEALSDCCHVAEEMLTDNDRAPRRPTQGELQQLFCLIDATRNLLAALPSGIVDAATRELQQWCLRATTPPQKQACS